jgi:hypothetical protein
MVVKLALKSKCMHNYIPSLSAKPEMNKPLLIASYLPPGISYTRAEFQSVLNQNQNLLTDLSIFLGICNMVRYWTIGFGLFSDYFPAVKISSSIFCMLFFPREMEFSRHKSPDQLSLHSFQISK